MSSFILAFASDPQLDADLSPIGIYDVDGAEKLCYLAAREFEDGQVLAHFADDGSQLSPPHAVVAQMAKLGNIDGMATSGIQLIRYQGHEQQALGESGELYPADNEPFDLEFRHKWYDFGVGHPATGWGWRCEMHGAAATRDPTGHAIYHYADDTYSQFEGTTGAFVIGISEWQTDENGAPIQVYYCTSWDSRRFPEKADWYFAVQESGILRGKGRLLASEDSYRRLFWKADYTPPASGTWTDTGVVTVAPVGALYQLSETVVMTAGETIRLGDWETTFTGYWPTAGTPSAYIAIDPGPPALLPNGTHLWRIL